MDFYKENDYLSLLEKSKKLKLFLAIFNVVIAVVVVILYMLVNRENQLLMKILLCIILILSLYLDCYLLFETMKKYKYNINHHMAINKYDEVKINEFELINHGEKITKNGILFIVLEILKENKTSIYYLKYDYYNVLCIDDIKVFYARGHYISKVEGGVQ